MACSDYSALNDFWANGQFWDAVNCYYANQLGDGATQLMIFLTLGISLYVYSDEPVIVVVLGILFGGIMIAPLPAAIVNTAMLIGVIATAIVLFLLVRKIRGGSFA